MGDEVGRGHFGYTCAATVKKGARKGESVAVKVIPKAKVMCSFRNALLWHFVLMCNMLNLKTPHTHAVFLDFFFDHVEIFRCCRFADCCLENTDFEQKYKIFIGFCGDIICFCSAFWIANTLLHARDSVRMVACCSVHSANLPFWVWVAY
jgi:hypothetical protein